MNLEEARKHLDLAKEQWEKASVAWWEPSDAATCVTNAFYAYENLIVAIAEARGRKWEKSHYKKADLAAALFTEKILSVDVSRTILELNDLRKDVAYGEPGDELGDSDLERFVGELEKFIQEVDRVIQELEEEAAEEAKND